MSERRNVLRGVEASRVLLTISGLGFGFLVVGVSVGLAKPMHKSSIDESFSIVHRELIVGILWWLGFVVLSGICFAAEWALQHSRKWGIWFVTLIGAILLIFGLVISRTLVAPYAPGSIQGEDSLIFLIAAPCLAAGAWLCIYPNLPHVRRHFSKEAVVEPLHPSLD